MKFHKQTLREKVMVELAEVGEWYRKSESRSARDHYNLYATILIQNNEIEDQENLFTYWERLKNEQSK